MTTCPGFNARCGEIRRTGAGMPSSVLLVIGYGNDLRCDDGAGVRAAVTIAARDLPLRVIVSHQLTPDLVDDIAIAAQVVFIDAYAASNQGAGLRIERIGGDGADSALGHHANPARLLGLTGRLCGRAPEAWAVGIPAFCFDAGETISPETAQRIDDAVALFGE